MHLRVDGLLFDKRGKEMLKMKVSMLLLFLIFGHTLECKELRPDIQLLVACGFIKELQSLCLDVVLENAQID